MVKVMLPIWTDIENRINANGDLFIGSAYPVAFLMMLTHICSWKLLMATWEGTDALHDPKELPRHRNFAELRFPQEYLEYVTNCYNALQERKAQLLAQLRPEALHMSALSRAAAGPAGSGGDDDSGTYFESARRLSTSSGSFEASSPGMGMRRRISRQSIREGDGGGGGGGGGKAVGAGALEGSETTSPTTGNSSEPSPGTSFKRSFF